MTSIPKIKNPDLDHVTAVAVSGGADSLHALVRLRERGESVFALHARMLPPELAPADYPAMLQRLEAACARIGVALRIVDCIDKFTESVINPFVFSYAAGLTPNPCALCNAAIKFGLLADAARALGATRLATGHYARIVSGPEGTALFAGEDNAKDQSYFLSLTPSDKLSFAIMPLAEEKKTDVLAFLAARSIAVPSPGESQEICFVPNDDYRAFLTARAGRLGVALPGPGPVVLPDGVAIGEHRGLWQYTEGQRRGLGIAWKESLYVIRKDVANNALVAGGADFLAGGAVRAENFNFLAPFARWPETVLVRTRFRQKPRPAKAVLDGAAVAFIEQTPSGPHAKGQIAAAYAPGELDGKPRLQVLGGGVIS